MHRPASLPIFHSTHHIVEVSWAANVILEDKIYSAIIGLNRIVKVYFDEAKGPNPKACCVDI
jgi:hypothetical protein